MEEAGAVLNRVGLGVLKVGIGIHTQPVACLDDRTVGRVVVGGPGVNVAHGSIAQAGSLDGVTNTLDISNQGVRVGTRELAVLDTSWGVAVEVLTADGNTGDKTVQLVTVLVNSLLESLDLAIEGVVAGRCPEAEEKAGLGLDSSWDSGDGVVGGTALLFTIL